MEKRITAFAMALLMLLCTVSCGDGNDQTNETKSTETTKQDTAVTETQSPYIADELPDLDFNGASVRFAVQSNRVEEYYVEEISGETVNDAIHYANMNVEERLGVDLSYIPFQYASWDDRDTYMKAIETSVIANDNSFDILVSTGFISGFMVNGLLLNLLDKPHLDLDKPWWSQDMIEQATYNNVLPFITGDASIGKTKGTMCMFFNKKLYTDYGMEDLYTLVKEGKWTIDKMDEFSEMAYTDLNGNTEADVEDRFGLVLEGSNYYMGFLDSCRIEVVGKNEEQLSFLYDNERNTNIIQKLVEIISTNPGITDHGGDDSSQYLAEDALFKDGNVLFTGGWIHCAASYRNLDFDYGILPYPKFDETQEKYGATVLNIYSNYALPVSNQCIEESCAVLEAIGSEYYRNVTPAYFEITLKAKYSLDNEMSQMFDLLRDNASFNMGLTFANALNYVADELKNTLITKNPNWASKMASVKKTADKNINNLLEAYIVMGEQ